MKNVLNVVGVVVASCIGGNLSAQIVVNGSLTGTTAQSTVPSGWTAEEGTPDTADVDFNGVRSNFAVTPGPSSDGGTWVSMVYNSTLSPDFTESFFQSVTLVPGEEYTISWEHANFGGETEFEPSYTEDGALTLQINDTSVYTTASIPLQANTWTSDSYTFTATQATNKIEFWNNSGTRSYLSVDGVSVIPEPSSAPLLGIMVAFGFVARRRRGN